MIPESSRSGTCPPDRAGHDLGREPPRPGSSFVKNDQVEFAQAAGVGNGCSACVDSGARATKKAGESDERLFAVAAWREAPFFTDAERAAPALTEAATRLALLASGRYPGRM
jgi:AhpD family alkylhydroperoxidase